MTLWSKRYALSANLDCDSRGGRGRWIGISGHIKKRPESVRRRTATALSCTIAGQGETEEPPLMLGPVYLHWDGSYETYRAFFAHLRCKLDNINISGLEFGV